MGTSLADFLTALKFDGDTRLRPVDAVFAPLTPVVRQVLWLLDGDALHKLEYFFVLDAPV
jgi:hypothetical protein